MSGAPIVKITGTLLALVAMFLIVAVVLIVTNHPDQGTYALSTAVGIVLGGAATTTVVVQQTNRANGQAPTTPTPAPVNEPPKAP